MIQNSGRSTSRPSNKTNIKRQGVGAAMLCAFAAQASQASGSNVSTPNLAPTNRLTPAWAPIASPAAAPTPPVTSPVGVALNRAAKQALVYQGGHVITQPQVSNIFWNGDVVAQEHLNSFVRYTLEGAFMSSLAEYGLQNNAVGKGMLLDTTQLEQAQGSANYTTQDVVGGLAQLVANGSIAAPSSDRIALVYLPPDATFTETETGRLSCNADMLCADPTSCTYFCGTSGLAQLSSGSLYYAVIMTDPTCVGCFSGTEVTDTVAAILANTITNPDSKGWSTTDGESMAAQCDSTTWKDGYRFADLWSNCWNQCVPVGTTTFQKEACALPVQKSPNHTALYIGLGTGIGGGLGLVLAAVGLKKRLRR